MVTGAGFPFRTIATSKKHKQKKRKRGKNNRRENLPRYDRRGGGKIKQEQKNKSKDPPRISERQIDKQARQTKCQDHTTVDTVRESLSTPHQSLGGGSGQSSVETRTTSIATRKITRYSSAAFKSTSWELKRQSSEKFLRVAGVGLVHTLGGPGRHEDSSPRLYFTVPLRCILGGPHPTLGVDSEGSAVFRDTVFEAFRRLAPFSLPPDHFASDDDVGEAIVVHARDAAGVVEDTLHHSSLNALTVSSEEDLEV